ncbi:MAG: 4-alpha-glucanotransferase [Ignavibacteria bacterium]
MEKDRRQKTRRSCLPLFSIYSKNSTGIGEIPDLKKMVDWCINTDLSIIQLLPLNEVGFDFLHTMQ